ncbi:MAG: hypothetical protein MPW16_09495 [Candidatus Manganitrophus sp.]|nr:MAG: hypothetical protein MPW16_09495 [Candidatus Manganitrophus sp.]
MTCIRQEPQIAARQEARKVRVPSVSALIFKRAVNRVIPRLASTK